jgi:hypothetical protein
MSTTGSTQGEPAVGSVPAARPRGRPSRGARRTGYVFGLLFNLLFLWLVNVWPGWDAVPFLTGDFADVVWLVDLSLWAGVVSNAIYVVSDPRWLTALGGVVTTAIGLAAAVRLWQVFPFDLNGSDVWRVLVQVALVVGIVGSAIGIVVNLVTFARSLTSSDART